MQTKAVAREASRGCFAEVAPQMEPVGDLDGSGRPDAGALSKEQGPVATDDLDPRKFGRPSRGSALLATRE
ncbi:hypothetical protein ACE1SV_49150 [Streptomyces sp. E-15]